MARASQSKSMPPGSGPLQPSTAVVLYHRRTGAIFSTHHFSAANGARLPDRDELERIARAQAVRGGGDEAVAYKALHVDPAALKPGVGYRVSIAKGELVAVKLRRQNSPTAGA